MNLSDLQDLDFENVGGWPGGVKITALILVLAIILVAGYFYKTKDQWSTYQTHQAQEAELKIVFAAKQKKAARLEGYRAQLNEMKIILRSMLRQLPSKTEMPDLLVDVSQTALSTGIENKLFEPGPETVKTFYAEKPITLKMIGTYHEFGAFVSGVASLPRVVILTMHDISLRPTKSGGRAGELVLEGTAKTYRYVEESSDEFASLEEVTE